LCFSNLGRFACQSERLFLAGSSSVPPMLLLVEKESPLEGSLSAELFVMFPMGPDGPDRRRPAPFVFDDP